MAMTERTGGMAAPEAGSAKKILFELQVEQHHHDETYHREIARLSLHQRLNHMALHFAKYTGRVAAAVRVEDAVPEYVDTLIIGLSTANVLNIEIWDILEHEGREFPGLLAFGRSLAQRVGTMLRERNELLRETSIAAGRIAAACEKIDHLEEISFRAEIKFGLAKLVTLSLVVIASNGLDPAIAVRTRLNKVKERLRLHGRI
jgi:hypothetical protein